MLNKSVCKKCSERWAEIWRAQRAVAPSSGWDESDAKRWREGRVYCPNIDVTVNDAIISKPPPEWCYCRLEQAVAAGMENKDADKQ